MIMNKKVIVGLVVSVALVFVFSSCKQFEPEITDMISEEKIKTLEDDGMIIHEGTTPPNIEGVYYADSLYPIYDSTGQYSFVFPYYFKFYDQDMLKNEITVDYDGGGGIDIASGKGAFISGSFNNFSIFVEMSGEYPDLNVEYTQVTIYSGTKSIDGVRNFQLGIVMMDKKGDDSDTILMPVDARRIFEEQDGSGQLAESSSWPKSAARSVEREKALETNLVPLGGIR